MENELDGKKVREIWFDRHSHVASGGHRTLLVKKINYLRDEWWVLQIESGVEVARHNLARVETIKWMTE